MKIHLNEDKCEQFDKKQFLIDSMDNMMNKEKSAASAASAACCRLSQAPVDHTDILLPVTSADGCPCRLLTR